MLIVSGNSEDIEALLTQAMRLSKAIYMTELCDLSIRPWRNLEALCDEAGVTFQLGNTATNKEIASKLLEILDEPRIINIRRSILLEKGQVSWPENEVPAGE